jgi:long-subunit fatty acid transport protein
MTSVFHLCGWLLILIAPWHLMAAYSNFNSVLIGEQASGMGGAYTAMSGDSSSSGFYNPASLSKLQGSDISASATLFNKFDTSYGESANILEAGERVNRGFFRTIPSSIGNVYRWKKWAFGFSLVVPDYDFFSGNIADTPNTQSFLNYTDESLWNGIVGSYRASKNEHFGISLYYTARSLIRSSLDRQVISPSHEIITTEEKSITHNAIVVVLGYLWDMNDQWSFGLSVRPPGLTVHGEGTHYLAVTDTNNLPSQTQQTRGARASTYIPPRYSAGAVYRPTDRLTLSFDTTYYTGHSYQDMDLIEAADQITHRDTWNAAMGMQYYFKEPKFAWRAGIFTNRSSHPTPPANPTQRMGDSIDMYGFSSNVSFYVTEHSKYTLGGFYSGGRGISVQNTGNELVALSKNHHIFSLLVSTSYHF